MGFFAPIISRLVHRTLFPLRVVTGDRCTSVPRGNRQSQNDVRRYVLTFVLTNMVLFLFDQLQFMSETDVKLWIGVR
jgi:hypothetical protein